MDIDNPRADDLKELESELDRRRSFARIATAEADRASQEAETVYATLGWRERHLAGWLFGDRALAKSYRELRREAERLTARKESAANAVAEADDVCRTAVAAHLRGRDPDFLRTEEAYRKVDRPHGSGMDLLLKIETAQRELDEAESMETLDLVSKNKGLSMLSHIEVDEARAAIAEVRQAAATFQADLQAYGAFLTKNGQDGTAVHDPGDTLDLVCDLVGVDGFDFTSLLTLSRLHEAESDLYELKEKTETAMRVITERLNRAKAEFDGKVSAFRSALLQG